jgi:hypothetical protein
MRGLPNPSAQEMTFARDPRCRPMGHHPTLAQTAAKARPFHTVTELYSTSAAQPSSNARPLNIAFRQLDQRVPRHIVDGSTTVRAVFDRGVTVTKL